MELDKEKNFTPIRVLKQKKNIVTIFSDHFSLKILLKGIPRRIETDENKTVWNLGKPNGWEVYKASTNEVSDKIASIAEDDNLNINSVMTKINAIETKVKFKAFGKTKPSMKTSIKESKCKPRCKMSTCQQCKNQKQKDEETHMRQTQKMESAIQRIKESKQGRVGNVFMLKKYIAGPNKTPQESAAVRDPNTGELLVNKEDIKKATLKYCVDNLQNNIPDDDVINTVRRRKTEQLKKMQDKSGETFDVTYEEYEYVLDRFKMETTKTYDFLIKSRAQYKKAIFTLCKRIIEQEDIPDCFRTTTLYMIWKWKGPVDTLKNNRFLQELWIR